MSRSFAALVEGHTEREFFHRSMSGVLAMRVIQNGGTLDVALESIERGFRTLGINRSKIIILFDREGSELTCQQLIDEVRARIEPYRANRTVVIGVPNREIENWMLAAQPLIRSTILDEDYQYGCEGSSGKSRFERLTSIRSPAEKAQFLKKAVASDIAECSSSFDDFLRQFDDAFDWYWIKR